MSAPRVSLEQWQAFVEVVDAQGYGRAAERLHKSQSAVTYLVQKMESALGVKLFTLEGRRAVLTPIGASLHRRGKSLLAEAARLELAAGSMSNGWEAEITLAVEMLFPTRIILEVLDALGRELPETRIELIESVLSGTTHAILSGAHLAIASSIPPGLLGDPLMELRLIAVAHPDHPLNQLHRLVEASDLQNHRHLVVREVSPQRPARVASLETHQRWTVSHMTTSIEAARRGYGFAWLPEERIWDELDSGSLKPIPLKEGAERYARLYLITPDPENAGPGVRRLRELLRAAVDRNCKKRRTD